MAGFESILGNGGERPVGKVSVENITATLVVGETEHVHHENDAFFVTEHIVGMILFLSGDLEGS